MADYDVAIIGAGPAGITAGIYLARSGRKVVIIEAGAPGGQVFVNHLIENYPGFPEPIPGAELAERMQKQVERLGVEIKNIPITNITKQGDGEFVLEGLSTKITARAVIIATGSTPKPLNVPGEEKLFGAGVSYCSTCDGMFFKGKDVVVVGGGNSALQGAEHLARICKTVTLIHRRDAFRGDVILVQRIKKIENIEIMTSSVVMEITGDKKANGVNVRDIKTSAVKNVRCDGVFIYIGSTPQSAFVKDIIECSPAGYIKVQTDMSTSLEGLFAAGDVVEKESRQIVTAVSDGCIAALSVDKYLSV
ncbi:MAG: thioredoxin-disulfide reductase [Pseudomonadota bacterium]